MIAVFYSSIWCWSIVELKKKQNHQFHWYQKKSQADLPESITLPFNRRYKIKNKSNHLPTKSMFVTREWFIERYSPNNKIVRIPVVDCSEILQRKNPSEPLTTNKKQKTLIWRHSFEWMPNNILYKWFILKCNLSNNSIFHAVHSSVFIAHRKRIVYARIQPTALQQSRTTNNCSKDNNLKTKNKLKKKTFRIKLVVEAGLSNVIHNSRVDSYQLHPMSKKFWIL